jgi:hypothetical protein
MLTDKKLSEVTGSSPSPKKSGGLKGSMQQLGRKTARATFFPMEESQEPGTPEIYSTRQRFSAYTAQIRSTP